MDCKFCGIKLEEGKILEPCGEGEYDYKYILQCPKCKEVVVI